MFRQANRKLEEEVRQVYAWYEVARVDRQVCWLYKWISGLFNMWVRWLYRSFGVVRQVYESHRCVGDFTGRLM